MQIILALLLALLNQGQSNSKAPNGGSNITTMSSDNTGGEAGHIPPVPPPPPPKP